MAQLDTLHLVDPQLRTLAEARRGFSVTAELLPLLRQAFVLPTATPAGAVPEVEFTRRTVPGWAGDPDVGVAVYRPKGISGPLPCVLHLHGGGYIVGDPWVYEPIHRAMALELGCVLVSVDYRLAPETPFPGAVHDAYAALAWVWAEADKLGVDRSRIGVSGESAGAGLAACLALLARDRGEYPLAFQHLTYPMLDDRTCVRPDQNLYAGEFIWTRESNRFGWTCLLGAEPGGDDVSPYAAASRATDLSALPSIYIATGALDLFVDECLDYAQRLIRSGVPTELHVYAGAFHGYGYEPAAEVSVTAARDSLAALRRFLARTPAEIRPDQETTA